MGTGKKEGDEKEEITFYVEFHPEADSDLGEAYEFYEERRAGLGDEFLLSIEAALNYISREPYHFQKIFSQTRHTRIKRFPFGIHYVLTRGKVYVTAILHLSRNPSIWKRRK